MQKEDFSLFVIIQKIYRINPTKIALQGSSAGASSSYWLGVRSDMADASSENPMNREATRVCAVFMSGPQASLDFYR